MTPHGQADSAHREPQNRSGIPDTVWVRHGEQTYELSVFCPESWPYSTTIIMRAMYGGTRAIVMPDGREVTMTGHGLSSSDPLYCPELQEDRLPQCRCGYRHPFDAAAEEAPQERAGDIKDA